ncbi:MAG: sulfocyanin [Saccharolobus sp.]|jgi:hypothetical protein|uniref:sulfocyanin n=1 Tax=Saccharolobus sp. TaxID=2100761 RepID=UPI0028CC1946|nr:sulfocyanin [Saccharolobus sp.]MDT7862633.1 sulfocyanin [Saccharolobus sp.]
MRINKMGIAILGISVAILIIGGVFFGMAAVSHNVVTTAVHTATTTTSSSAPVWG